MDSLSSDFEITTQLPCLPIFDCVNNKVDTTIYGRIIFSKNGTIDSTNIFPLTIRPALFNIEIEPCEYMCPSRIVT